MNSFLSKSVDANHIHVWSAFFHQEKSVSQARCKMEYFLKHRGIEKIFLDTNALMFMYGRDLTTGLGENNKPASTSLSPEKQLKIKDANHDAEKAAAYAGVIKNLRAIGMVICVHEIVFSEFVGLCFNEYFRSYCDRNEINHRSYKTIPNKHVSYRQWIKQKKKKYRDSKKGKEDIKTISDRISEILAECEKIEINIGKHSIEKIMKATERGKMEFNDCLIAHICRHEGNKMALLTDDEDFASVNDIPIVTANSKLKQKAIAASAYPSCSTVW